jgi:hypothetical protein
MAVQGEDFTVDEIDESGYKPSTDPNFDDFTVPGSNDPVSEISI